MSADAFAALRAQHLNIGMLIFPNMDQIDFTGPFEVLARIRNTQVHIIGTQREAVRDCMGLTLTPDMPLGEAPDLDVLHVPGGPGQEALMRDEPILAFIRKHVEAGKPLFSVCTGALLCGAAGVLAGRRATTHWASFDLLPYFGAIPVRERVVVDGAIVSAAGVTAGIDGALTLAALLRDDAAAQRIQLDIQYAPDPPFNAGDPATAPAGVLADARVRYAPVIAARRATAQDYARRHGIWESDATLRMDD
jgi:cyclohexyl-isocyanide hydratase